MGVFVEQDGAERQDGQRVAVLVLMRMADGTELRAAAIFEFAQGKVALFQFVMIALRPDSEPDLRGTTLSPQPLMTLVLAAPQTAALDEHQQPG